jgi:hypothetical protein
MLDVWHQAALGNQLTYSRLAGGCSTAQRSYWTRSLGSIADNLASAIHLNPRWNRSCCSHFARSRVCHWNQSHFSATSSNLPAALWSILCHLSACPSCDPTAVYSVERTENSDSIRYYWTSHRCFFFLTSCSATCRNYLLFNMIRSQLQHHLSANASSSRFWSSETACPTFSWWITSTPWQNEHRRINLIL